MSSIKLTADSGGGTFEIKAPSSSGNTRSFTLPDVATGLGGITEFDQFYLSANITSDGDITSNLVRNNFSSAASQIGTGMTESSGIFSFPTTGKYLIICNGTFNCNGSDNVIIYTATTTNNSSYTNVAIAIDGNNSSSGVSRTGQATSMFFIDVTDVSQVKVKFVAASIGVSSSIRGDNTGSALSTGFIFIRLGDT